MAAIILSNVGFVRSRVIGVTVEMGRALRAWQHDLEVGASSAAWVGHALQAIHMRDEI